MKLDNPTEGFGNCFPNAIVQQCRRPEIKTWIQKNRPWALFTGHQMLRRKVTNFALRSRDQTINRLKIEYEQEIGPAESKSWEEYWYEMAKVGTWVDHIFIQLTAWYMALDILILTTSSQPKHPFIIIKGRDNDTGSEPSLILGNYTNVHYQSLLPEKRMAYPLEELSKSQGKQKEKYSSEENITTRRNKQQGSIYAANQQEPIKSKGKKISHPLPEKTATSRTRQQEQGKCEEKVKDDFIITQGKLTITFKGLEKGKWECPYCQQTITKIRLHINNKDCPITQLHIDKTELIRQFDDFMAGYRRDMSRKRKQRSRAKLKEERGIEAIKKENEEQNKRNRAKLIKEKGPKIMRQEMRDQKQKSRAKLLKEKGPEVIKKEIKVQKDMSRAKLLEEKGPEVIKKEMKVQKDMS